MSLNKHFSSVISIYVMRWNDEKNIWTRNFSTVFVERVCKNCWHSNPVKWVLKHMPQQQLHDNNKQTQKIKFVCYFLHQLCLDSFLGKITRDLSKMFVWQPHRSYHIKWNFIHQKYHRESEKGRQNKRTAKRVQNK